MNKYKKLMVITAMTAALGTSAFAASTGITDISNYWGKAAIQYFYNQHYISGTNGQFRPNEDITREGAAAIINNMIGEDSKVKTTNFSDVKGRWSERAIASLVDKQPWPLLIALCAFTATARSSRNRRLPVKNLPSSPTTT